ncbi:ArdC-like ssDNA-binding domain-containing protein [Anaerofustis stercorihominis]|uniref:ArdC-like ssDNA-binding domain-containing protein n=1 Tax=Anaerofustis stercorihominis TaxID=214853 RepID=UPI00210C4EE7|nr:ArdC-like ssDNA-binding domain-containing protein [Anaerofustis stercorihominis]MCQ4794153.1 ArdC-like ssDNA-binding domain-containing protein [Anaerofustis stercorihominis]
MEYDKQAYKEKKQAELAELFDTLNEETEEIAKDSEKYKAYLDTQARMERYSVSNVILLSKQRPDARQVKSFDDWKKLKVQVKRGEKGIAILEPYKYQKENGKIGTAYNVKRVFDVMQTDVRPREKMFLSDVSERGLLKALINEAPVPIEVVESLENGKNAEYAHEKQTLYIKRGLEPGTFFRAVSKELALAEFEVNNDFDYTKKAYIQKAEAVSYMLCRRYGIEPQITPEIPEIFHGKEAKEIRRELSESREIFREINDRMNEAIEKQREAKREQER